MDCAVSEGMQTNNSIPLSIATFPLIPISSFKKTLKEFDV